VKQLWLRLVLRVLAWLINNCDFKLFTCRSSMGHRLGGHDDPNLPDLYIVIGIWYRERPLLVGYWQKA